MSRLQSMSAASSVIPDTSQRPICDRRVQTQPTHFEEPPAEGLPSLRCDAWSQRSHGVLCKGRNLPKPEDAPPANNRASWAEPHDKVPYDMIFCTEAGLPSYESIHQLIYHNHNPGNLSPTDEQIHINGLAWLARAVAIGQENAGPQIPTNY